MAGFRDIKTLQKFAAIHASIQNHFNKDRPLNLGRVASTWGLSSADYEVLQTSSCLSDGALHPHGRQPARGREFRH